MPFLELVFAANEKRALFEKLRGAREHKREAKGKCEGRKSYSETNPELVRQAKRLRRVNPLTKKRRSFQNIADELYTLGYEAKKGGRLTAKQVQLICAE